MVMLTGLARVARDAGITVREVAGWKTRTAHRGGLTEVRGILWHHTATAAKAVKERNNPTLKYMTDGLGYPLANYGLAWDGSLDVIAAGTGAHAGAGSYSGIPTDDGNRYLIGVEVEGTTGLEWSDAQLETAAILGAAFDEEYGKELLNIGHYEWAPRRKVDPTGIPGNMSALRAAIKRGSWNGSGATPVPSKPSTGTASSGSSSSSSKAWPHAQLAVTSAHTTASHRAWVAMLAGVGFKDSRLTLAIQKWLQWNGYYRGYNLDGQFGPATVRALQAFLKSKGFYEGVLDGSRGPLTIQAEIRYINSQARHYK